MTAPPTACPRCHSTEVHRRQSRGDWVCDVCEHAWTPAAARPRVFLSYGRRDALDLADRLRADLEARGYEIWQDTVRIRSGKDWQGEIQDGLRDAQVVVALLTPHSVRMTGTGSVDELDSVCLDEVSYARFARPPKPVVPVMVIPCEPPFCIYRLDYIDLCNWKDAEDIYRAGLARLVEAVEAGLRGEVRYRSWDHQLRPWDFSAFLNEKRQHFCGREWLFDEIEAWRVNSTEKALLIVGDPGTGKSAIVAELVYRNPGGQVLAYHCCQADTKETLQPARFVRSLAALIASQIEGYAARLSDPAVEEALSEASCARDPASAFEAGILTPLGDLPPPPGGARYLLVDALDEALALEGPSRVTIVDVLASRLQRLPAWLRLVATTRKERAVLDRLSGLRAEEIDAHDPRNLEDLDRYVAQRLQSPALQERLRASGRSAEDVARVLREKADGNILYVIRSLEGIERDLYGFDGLDALPPGLYGLYLGYFQRQFPDEASFRPVRSVLEAIVAARKPLSERRLARATGLDPETEVPQVLRRLSAYLREHNERYTIYHKSLADWLTSAELRGTLYHVSRRRGHERLADLFWQEYQRGPATMTGYGLEYLAAHLVEIGRWDDLARLLGDLQFIRAKCAKGFVYHLQADYEMALDAWPGYQRYDPFDRPAPETPPAWTAECTAAVLTGSPVPHADKGAGPVLEVLRPLPEERRDGGVQPPRCRPGEALPAEHFGPDRGLMATLAEMRRVEKAGAEGTDPNAADTPAGRVLAFANFVSTHSHMLAAIPQETFALARNHAAGGPVAAQAEALVAAVPDLWVARDPRPPALPARPACLRTLQGHTNRVNGVALSPDGRLAVSASSDSSLRVWDVVSGLCRRTLQGHAYSVRGAALTADGTTAVSASHDGTLRVWDVATGACSQTLRGHTRWATAVALTPDGALAVSGSNDCALRIWDVATGRCLAVPGGHTDEVRAVALTPDGRVAVSAGVDGTVRVWDVAAGNGVRVLRGHGDAVNGVALSADGKLAVSASRDNTLRVWDVATGECLRALEGHTNWVNAVALTADARLAVSAGFDLTVRAWDLASGECVRVLAGHTAWIADVAVTPDGRLAVSAGSDHTLRVWDLASGESLPALPGHAAWVGPVVLSADGKRAVSPSRDHTARTWDVDAGRCTHTLTGHTNWVNAADLTPDGKTAVTASADATLRVWDMDSGNCVRVLKGHPEWVSVVAITPDGRGAVSAASDRTLRVWDLASGECLRVLEGHTDRANWLALSPDGGTAVSVSRDLTLRAWDVATGACLHTFRSSTDYAGPGGYLEGVWVAPDGRLIVSVGEDKAVRLWDVATGALCRTMEGHTATVEGACLTPDGRQVLSSSRDHTVRLWDVATGASVRTFAGHTYGVTSVATTPDGRLAVSASWDGTVRVWEMATGRCAAIYYAGARVAYVAVRHDGRVVCGSGDGQLHFLRLRNFTPGTPPVTAVRLRLFGGKRPAAAAAVAKWLPFLGGWLGKDTGYDRGPTALCPGCGKRFAPAAKVLDAVAGIARAAGLAPDQSPCLALPAEAWQEPALAAECAHCRLAVRFNPFVVDNQKE